MIPFVGKNLIGIDAGSYSTKVVWLKGAGGKGSYRLKSASYARSPSGDRSGFLHSVAASLRLAGKKAATVVYGPSLTVRRLSLPLMPDKDLREAVKWELRKDSDIPANELVCDFAVSGPDAKAEGGNLSVIAFAIKRAAVEGLMSEYMSAGIDIRVVESVPTALLASFDANNEWEKGVNYAFTDIGLASSTLAIFKDRTLAFVREIAFGGAEITDALCSNTGKDADECDETKASCSIGSREGATAAKHVERLCADLHRSFEYYQAQYRGGRVERLYLSGGTARLKGIDHFVTDALGIPSFVDDPLRKSLPDADGDGYGGFAACLSVAFGAALRMASDG